MKVYSGLRWLGILVVLLTVSACNLASQSEDGIRLAQADQSAATETETIPPSTPLATLTPTNTLRPPPTFEPPTLTPLPTDTPAPTATPTLDLSISIPALQGLATPTAEDDTCQPREDWGLRYRVQPNDALASIAQLYNTYPNVLAEGNCLYDPNLIVVGQELRVPGQAHPETPEYVCVPWELLTPFNGAVTIPGEGSITFNWRGPQSLRYLVRLYRPRHGNPHDLEQVGEYLTEMRQNYTLDLAEIPEGGLYFWRVYPLGADFQQIPCTESEVFQFSKEAAPEPESSLIP